MKFLEIKQIDKGWSSFIYLVKDENGKEYIMKKVREKSPRPNLYEREGNMLSLANSVNVGPKIYEINAEENFVVMEKIEGQEFIRWINSKEFENVNAEKLYFFIKELYRQLYRLDSVGLSHNQLQGGKNILVSEKINSKGEIEFIPTIIDFEKSAVRENHKTRNIGQIDDFFFNNPHSFVAKKMREKLNLELTPRK